MPERTPQKTVLITGCSEGGFGAALCKEFQRRGFCVFATLRNPAKAATLQDQDGNVEVLALDVTSAESIQKCEEYVRAKTGGALDILVNNAGSMLMGPILDASLSDGRNLFEINFWGLLAVTQAFAPLVVKAKGSIVNICSIAGAVRLAWQGIYSSSKVAATFLSETLRVELEPLGVKVVTAMIGEIETNMYTNATAPELPEKSYCHTVKSFIAQQAAGKLSEHNEPAEKTARNVVDDVLNGASGQIWRGGIAGTASILHWLLPTRVFVSPTSYQRV